MKTIKVAAAIIKNDDLFLIAQRLKGDYAGLWEFPGGKIESGETPLKALKREIQEELNLEIYDETYFETIQYEYPTIHLEMACYLCGIKEEPYHLHDHSAIQWIHMNEKILESINWVPADAFVVNDLVKSLRQK